MTQAEAKSMAEALRVQLGPPWLFEVRPRQMVGGRWRLYVSRNPQARPVTMPRRFAGMEVVPTFWSLGQVQTLAEAA